MPALLHVGMTALCPHGGQVSAVPSQTRVLLSQQPALTLSDAPLIAGCAFNISGAPHPCVKVQFVSPATRILLGGTPAVLQTSTALSLAADQAPQGPPSIVMTQVRVNGQ